MPLGEWNRCKSIVMTDSLIYFYGHILYYALVTPRPDVPDKTMPDGARRSQMEPDGARQKNCCFGLTSWTRRFQEFLGTDCARRHQIFLFVYLTEGTDWLVSGVPGVKEADRNGQKRSGSVWHGFVWHGWSWCNQSIMRDLFL